jgi:hypothetical protein
MHAARAGATHARRVFDAMHGLVEHYAHGVRSRWTAGDIDTVVSLFDAIPEPDAMSWNAQKGAHRMIGSSETYKKRSF